MKKRMIFFMIFLLFSMIPISMAYESLTEYHANRHLSQDSSTKVTKRSGGGGFITLWTRPDDTSPCQKADVITIKGKIIDGKYGVAVDFNTKKKVKMPQTCPITPHPIMIGWWNPKYVRAFLNNVPTSYYG